MTGWILLSYLALWSATSSIDELILPLIGFSVLALTRSLVVVLSDRYSTRNMLDFVDQLRSKSATNLFTQPEGNAQRPDFSRFIQFHSEEISMVQSGLLRRTPALLDLIWLSIIGLISITALSISTKSLPLSLTLFALTTLELTWLLRHLKRYPSSPLSETFEEILTSDQTQREKPVESPAEEDSPKLSALGRIKEFRWTDCEVSLDEDLQVTFPWGIASVGKLTVIKGEAKQAKKAVAESIMGVHPLLQGRIFVDSSKGVYRLEEIDENYLRSLFSWVKQSPGFTPGTVEENLRLIKQRANRQRLGEVLAEVGLDEVALPEGLKTVIGSKGQGLSQSTLMRLAVARAILKDAPIVIAEDAPVTDDSEISDWFNGTLKNMARAGKAVICISENPELHKLADRIITIDSEEFEPKFILEAAQ
jgi:ABC-type transport system involved in cytochrome bd biosynthesis fused ATPase/permease subunit